MIERFAFRTSARVNGTMLIACLIAAVFILFAGTAGAQTAGSKHDLGTAGGAQQKTSLTTEVCVFCHTPHGSDTSASAPLWNKNLAQPTGGYQRYSTLNTSTLDGEEAPVGSVSLACLSCHDGTQAMDVLINAPGQDGYTAGGAEFDTAAIGTMTGTPIPNLGTDLRNDHPISIQYAGGGCSTTDTACTDLGDKDFKTPATALINNVQQWWVNTAAAGSTTGREKTDMILYTRSDGPSAVTEPFVECASCHDPHEATVQPVSFMRINNQNSAVCLACHSK